MSSSKSGDHRQPGVGNRLLVLGFHNVESTWCWPAAPGIGLRRFTRHLQILDRFTNVVDLTEALDTLASGGSLPPRAVALTFDDGYRDNLTLAATALRRFAMPATIFLVPGLLDRSVDAWWERLGWVFGTTSARSLQYRGETLSLAIDDGSRLAAQRRVEEDVKSITHVERVKVIDDLVAELAPRGTYDADELFLDWDSARELPGAGFTVGSHTMEHPILARESRAGQRFNLTESKRQLNDRLGVDARVLAYPNGTQNDYDSTTLTEVADAGYSYAVTTWGGRVSHETPPFEISRALVGPTTRPARFGGFLAKRLSAH